MSTVEIKLKGRVIEPHKAVVGPKLGARNVLTNEPWTFVSLWLKRENKGEAHFYWEQAYEFYKASLGLPIQSAPLVLYYSFMNAVKALLVAKSIPFDPHHGVRSHNMRSPTSKISITNEAVKILNSGVLPSLSKYYRESESLKIHSLQDLFFNMVFIHRTYCLTYKRQTDMFLPLVKCVYKMDKTSKNAFFSARLSEHLSPTHKMNRLPPTLIPDFASGSRAIRSAISVQCSKPSNLSVADLEEIGKLHLQLRSDVHYINGTQALWYVKVITSGPRRLSRQSPTLVLAAMHRLSEICRYRPLEWVSFLSGQKNWLLSEFIQMSPSQFVDEIASEITGHQFLVPNVRTPT